MFRSGLHFHAEALCKSEDGGDTAQEGEGYLRYPNSGPYRLKKGINAFWKTSKLFYQKGSRQTVVFVWMKRFGMIA